jgi:hypothetical protein
VKTLKLPIRTLETLRGKWRVVYRNKILGTVGEYDGCVLPTHRRIVISETLAKRGIEGLSGHIETLIHEVLHILVAETDLMRRLQKKKKEEEREEEMVSVLAEAIALVLERNLGRVARIVSIMMKKED